TPPADTDGTQDTDTDTDTEPEPVEPLPVKFQYYAPGNLTPGSGTGTANDTNYAPDMVFPIKAAPAFPQSQVWRFGGGIGGGDQCDPRNYEAPWQDNFCEQRSRTRTTPMCPTNKVHQGQDIRVGTAAGCNQMRSASAADRTLYEAVAVENGVIQYKGGYYIQLRGTDTGNIYNYIHLNMAALKVDVGDTVTPGQSLGYVSNDFGGTPTTFHLHFEIKAPLEGQGITHVPPYMTLVKAYERREQGRGELIEDDAFSIASIPTIPEGFEIIE
ncbi:MAG: M23 family metallopeptidase, partial [Alphaproteobacteria bacterium]|nr:M23 family metallopeptidase [Alphaproteobacteria bacterium]